MGHLVPFAASTTCARTARSTQAAPAVVEAEAVVHQLLEAEETLLCAQVVHPTFRSADVVTPGM